MERDNGGGLSGVARVNWDNFQLLYNVLRNRVLIAYKPKMIGGGFYELTDFKDVTEDFERYIPAYMKALEEKGLVLWNNETTVLTIGVIEEWIKQIKELAEEIEELAEGHSEIEEKATEIQELAEKILKMKPKGA